MYRIYGYLDTTGKHEMEQFNYPVSVTESRLGELWESI